MNSEEILERRATVVRSRLLRAVDALDQRRHQVERVAKETKELAVPAALAVVGISVLFGASVYAFTAAIKHRRQLSAGERVLESLRNWDLARRPSFARRAGEKVMLSLLTFAATEIARRATKNFVNGRLLDGRLADEGAPDARSTELKIT